MELHQHSLQCIHCVGCGHLVQSKVPQHPPKGVQLPKGLCLWLLVLLWLVWWLCLWLQPSSACPLLHPVSVQLKGLNPAEGKWIVIEWLAICGSAPPDKVSSRLWLPHSM